MPPAGRSSTAVQATDRPLAGRRVLVTGASGFIGSHLTKRLVQVGAEVNVLVRVGGEHRRLESVRSRVQVWGGDVADIDAVRSAVDGARPEVVFHLAADTSARHAARDWTAVDQSRRVNVEGTLAVLRAATETPHRVHAVVRTGSIEEYGDGPTPFDERQREQPISPYSASQAAATHYCDTIQRGTDTSITSIRPALIYGPDQSTDFFIPSLIATCLRGEEFEMSAGTQRRDFLFVDDLIDALMIAGARYTVPGGILNVGSGVARPVREVAERIVRISGARTVLRIGARAARAGEPEELLLGNDAVAARLGWTPRTELDEGLRRTIDWYRGSGDGGWGMGDGG